MFAPIVLRFLWHERNRNGPFDVAGLRCILRSSRSDDLEQLFSDSCPIPWLVNRLEPNTRRIVHFKCFKEKINMSNEQKARKWLDSIVEGQNGGTKSLKSVRRARARHRAQRDDRPLNVLGCFALIHAIRSVSSGEQSRLGNRRTTLA